MITSWRFIDQSKLGPKFSPLTSFATDDTLCSSVGEADSIPVIRTWVHPHNVVLGIQDSRLPFIYDGIDYLIKQGYEVTVRNSGGLAVVLDEGILNISLIFKEDKKLSINSNYDAMVELVEMMFDEETNAIEAREISGSYCPGSYDLSIDGKKFAGISQRRVRSGVAVQIYLCVQGRGSDRAALIKEFYHLAVKEAETKFKYPAIIPNTMASLNELLGLNLNVQDVIGRLLIALKNNGESQLVTSQLNENEQQLFDKNYERIVNRQVASD